MLYRWQRNRKQLCKHVLKEQHFVFTDIIRNIKILQASISGLLK